MSDRREAFAARAIKCEHSTIMCFCEDEKRVSACRACISSSLSHVFIWLAFALFAYHLTARLRIKYSAFPWNEYVRSYVRTVVFSGSIDLYFSVFVCNVVSSWLFEERKKITFFKMFPFLLSPCSLPALNICTNDDFENGDDEYLILTCKLVKQRAHTTTTTLQHTSFNS